MTTTTRLRHLTWPSTAQNDDMAQWWKMQDFDPDLTVHTPGDGTWSVTSQTGTPVDLRLGTDHYLRSQIERFAHGQCPRCGGAWGERHRQAEMCPLDLPRHRREYLYADSTRR
jgi:hypothetical protein